MGGGGGAAGKIFATMLLYLFIFIILFITSSLFPIKIIPILQWTLSNIQQNIEQLQTPTVGATINKKSTTTEPPP